MAKTKIICTLGPATIKENVLLEMAQVGMNVARLNFSHATVKTNLTHIGNIQKLNKKYNFNIKILGDLEGFRIRIGELLGQSLAVKKEQIIWLTQASILGAGDKIPFNYSGSLEIIKKGQSIYIDDGNILLTVLAVKKNSIKTRVVVPGIIKEHKGINMPGVKFDFPTLNYRDRQNIIFCLEHKIDYIAQSFVRNKEDILVIKELLKKTSYQHQIIAKVENQEGINNIDEIIKASDGIMIARGDMGISIPVYRVPIVQKRIIKKCRQLKRFSITATQMLESMTTNPFPGRAEVSDVANAVLDGSDFVMLSGETAVGLYPVECVSMMSQIVQFTEANAQKI